MIEQVRLAAVLQDGWRRAIVDAPPAEEIQIVVNGGRVERFYLEEDDAPRVRSLD